MNKLIPLLFLVVIAVLLGSIGLFIKQNAAAPQERHFQVTARKFSYTPHAITVHRGDKVTMRLISEDVHHGLYLDGYELNTSAYPGSDGSISFTAYKTGRFAFRCSVTCGEMHPYMLGYLRVLPNTVFFVSLWSCLAVFAILLWKVRR